MTVVAAIVTPSESFIGSDSLAAIGELCAPSSSPKIAKFGTMLAGFAGSWRAGQQFFDYCSMLSHPTLKQALEFETTETDWNLLVVENGRIFEVASDRSVIEATTDEGYSYGAIGTGAPVALGALGFNYTFDRSDLLRALEVAGLHTTNVGGPYRIIGQRD